MAKKVKASAAAAAKHAELKDKKKKKKKDETSSSSEVRLMLGYAVWPGEIPRAAYALHARRRFSAYSCPYMRCSLFRDYEYSLVKVDRGI